MDDYVVDREMSPSFDAKKITLKNIKKFKTKQALKFQF